MIRIVCLSLLAVPLIAQAPFRTTRHAGLPPILIGDKFAAGDLDGDGDIDLFVANDNAANQLLLNDGSGRFVDATAGRFVMQPGPNATHSVDLADIDNDGDRDILIGNDDLLSNRVYVNNGLGFFTDVTATALPPNAEFTECQVVADFDGDGDVDWFTVDGGPCHYYANNGAGVFTDVSATRLAGLPILSGNRYAVTPFATDIDGDGDLDVMIPRYPAPPYLIQNQGGVLSPFPTQLPATATLTGSSHWFADYDGDGDADIFAADGSRLLQNQGNGTFVDVTTSAFLGGLPTVGLASFDVDNDGDHDLVTTSRVWWNNGNGTFTRSWSRARCYGATTPASRRPTSMATATSTCRDGRTSCARRSPRRPRCAAPPTTSSSTCAQAPRRWWGPAARSARERSRPGPSVCCVSTRLRPWLSPLRR